MKIVAGGLGIGLAILFLVLGFSTKVPDKHIDSYGTDKMEKYVGGDAYNFIIEASLRGGEIAGAKTAKAIYYGIAGILLIISCSFLEGDENVQPIRNDISEVKREVQNLIKSIDKLNETVKEIRITSGTNMVEEKENFLFQGTEYNRPEEEKLQNENNAKNVSNRNFSRRRVNSNP